MTKAKQGYDKLNAPDEETKERGEAVTKAIIENQGKDGREGLTQAVIAATGTAETPEVKAARQKLEELEAQRKADVAGKSSFDAQARRELLGAEIKRLKETKEGAQAVAMKNRREAVEQQLGQAANGDERQRAWLEGLVNANPNKFAAYGVKDTLGRDLAGASTEARKRAAERDAEIDRTADEPEESGKRAHEFFKDIRKDEKARATDAVTKIGPGVDDALVKALFDSIKGGQTPEAAMEGQRGGLRATLKGRGVQDDVIDKVAKTILEKGAAQAQNLINEGEKPKLDKQADREKDEAKRDHDRAVREKVHEVAPGFQDALEQAALRRYAAGQDSKVAYADLARQLKARLPSAGVGADLVEDVTKEIIGAVRRKVAGQVGKSTLPRLAAAEAVDHDQSKDAAVYGREFQFRTGANDQQTAYAGKMVAGLVSQGQDVQSAMEGTYAYMTNHLENVSDAMRRMLISLGQLIQSIAVATGQLAGVKNVQAQHNAKINMISNMQAQMRTRGPTGQNTMSWGG